LDEELDLTDRIVEVNKQGFEIKLEALIKTSLSNKVALKEQYAAIREDLLARKNAFHQVLRDWVANNL
ncbi:MAG: hypothetical protein AAGJ93_15150, partial [Bacteroidota bacterium]